MTMAGDVTIEEILASLKRSSLPTIVVEGKDDMVVYRTFENRLQTLGISVLPVGGRKNVLELYERRNELPATSKVIFIADRDTWVHSGVPSEYMDKSIIFTNGYSIENDIYLDGNLRSLLQGQEQEKYANELRDFIEWYALAVSRHLNDATNCIKHHPDFVLNPAERQALMTMLPGEVYPENLRRSILESYGSLLRGKSLLALLIRNTNYKGRGARHTSGALLESVAIRPGPLLQDLYSRVEQQFITE